MSVIQGGMAFDGMGHYVEGALRLLQFVEARRPTDRRFGANADARWSTFRGDLETADRIELMIRDADAEWPGGFGARLVYQLEGVAEDDPFGARWQGMDPVEAEELWRRLKRSPAPASLRDTLVAIATAWSVDLQPFARERIEPDEQLVVAGVSAIASTIETFAHGSSLDWADQVTVVASAPAPRQLAAAATALLNSSRASRIVAATAPSSAVRGARLIASSDADPADRAAAQRLVDG